MPTPGPRDLTGGRGSMARGKEHVLGDWLGLSPILPPPSADGHSYPLPSLPSTPWDLSDLLLCFGRVGDRLRISMSVEPSLFNQDT